MRPSRRIRRQPSDLGVFSGGGQRKSNSTVPSARFSRYSMYTIPSRRRNGRNIANKKVPLQKRLSTMLNNIHSSNGQSATLPPRTDTSTKMFAQIHNKRKAGLYRPSHQIFHNHSQFNSPCQKNTHCGASSPCQAKAAFKATQDSHSVAFCSTAAQNIRCKSQRTPASKVCLLHWYQHQEPGAGVYNST